MYLFMLLVASLIASSSAQISCHTCTGAFYVGSSTRDPCFDAISTSSMTPCAASDYCRTKITLQDGLPSSVARGCQDPAMDHNPSTLSAPTSNECVTTLMGSGSNPTEMTECYYSCTTSDCNIQDITSSLISCASNCSFSNGDCDYTTGQCRCNSGFTGPDCATTVTVTPTYRSCVQCNGETDANCASATTSTQCPGDISAYQYCSTTRSTMVDTDGNEIRTIVSRGCTANYNYKDECFITKPADPVFNANYDYTCTSTCDTNGCNTLTADGLITGTETKGLYCVVCDDPTGTGICNFATSRQLCPSGSLYCFHNATYFISDKADLMYEAEPEYQLLSVHRGCATTALTSSCTTTTIASSLKRVVCQESCSDDGCNVGWPARPTCTQCTTDTANDIKDGFDSCLENPPSPTACTFPYHAYCTVQDYQKNFGRAASLSGYTRHMIRGCSYFNYPSQCVSSLFDTANGVSLLNCNSTCSTDGCNQGINGSNRLLQGFVTVTLPAIFGVLLQQFFF